ncbi:Cyclophilin-like [Cohaesibacter marisflavi]|uniref:Cyclophilin-like n=1 Tax=Cohaesibacter marisflavi TaxID=655353 RepID=A0A1I5EXK0_9HYPH|nr:cyclophilin-like fold protein [Cohaesibacter marisflavi]SFO16245.1 Cyclophilin-like [Cohaesibacter marisflavi]
MSTKAGTKILITVGAETVTAVLDDTPSGRDFAAMMPLELSLSDYSRTEKVADLPGKLSTDGAPRSYAASIGDITYYAPWGNLAIFYKSFPSASGLVRLGKIDGSMNLLLKNGTFKARLEIAG